MWTLTELGEMWPGVQVKWVRFTAVTKEPLDSWPIETRSAFGRAVIVDLHECEIDVFPFFDLVNSNKGTNLRVGCNPEKNVNLGASVKDFVSGSRRESGPSGEFRQEARRILVASN